MTKYRDILKVLACGLPLFALLLTGCSESPIETLSDGTLDGMPHIVLTFVTPNDGTFTRSATEDPDGYEAGIGYENYINIDAGDYKMYFFSYAANDTKGGTLLAEFTPTEITESSTGTSTTYTVTGDVPNELLSVSDFRIVMLANYGRWYPSVTAGTTTIDDLCEGSNTTFNAFKKFVIDEDNLIPFYGVQEYGDVSFATGETTTLTTPVSLLRAVAKVEVIFEPLTDQYDQNVVDKFESVSIVNYNSQGYNAPAGVYTAADYDTEMKKNPETENWPDEWVAGLHLVSKDANGNGINDSDNGDPSNPKTQTFSHISNYDGTSGTLDTWRIYVPEYNNMGTDYSYIQVEVDGKTYQLYFADYTDGKTTAYGEGEGQSMPDRLNLKRNNLYRYYVTMEGGYLRVHVDKWENTYDNDFEFNSDYTIFN